MVSFRELNLNGTSQAESGDDTSQLKGTTAPRTSLAQTIKTDLDTVALNFVNSIVITVEDFGVGRLAR